MAARKKYADEQIVTILKEAAAGGKTSELCRKYGISEKTFYLWRQKYSGMTVPDIKRLKALEEENLKLKKKVAELVLENDAAKAILSKNW